MASTKEMTLKIMACRQVYSGTNPRGDRYTIYEVDAQNMRGETINEKLRSFTALPIGEAVEVEVSVFNSEAHGKSFTLHPKNRRPDQGGSSELGGEVEALRRRVEKLEATVQRLLDSGATQGGDASSVKSDRDAAASW